MTSNAKTIDLLKESKLIFLSRRSYESTTSPRRVEHDKRNKLLIRAFCVLGVLVAVAIIVSDIEYFYFVHCLKNHCSNFKIDLLDIFHRRLHN